MAGERRTDAIRPLRRAELDEVMRWAAAEGWNPGPDDAEAFWAADPDGYLGVERDGELAAAGSIVSYEGRFGFMGLFIVRPELRGAGLGRRLWYHRRDALRARLRRGAAIGMDGVFALEHFYRKGGFRRAHRNLRMRGTAPEVDEDPGLRPLVELPFREIAEFDALHFGVPRERFLRRWIEPRGGLALGIADGGRLRGVGVIRRAETEFKVGPLFAEDEEAAERILRGLMRVGPGEPVLLDVPEVNAKAMALAESYAMEEVFGCARMYLGEPPPVPWDRVFGVTTFELG